jgi:hypothetical protein
MEDTVYATHEQCPLRGSLREKQKWLSFIYVYMYIFKKGENPTNMGYKVET